MQELQYDHIEDQIHDNTLTQAFEQRNRLAEHISKSMGISENKLRSNQELTAAALRLIEEDHPSIDQFQEDLWGYLANFAEWEGAAPTAREAGKNSFYNRAKAKAYIDQYWKNYNPAYPTFHGGGGDCANFVSQVLYAGGMPWTDNGNPNHYTWATNWYCKPGATNKDGDKRITLTWKVAASFRKYWEKHAARLLVISYKDAIETMDSLARQIFIGDPVQFCYANGVSYHTLVVTGYAWDKAAGLNDIVLASHTIDSNKRSLYHTMQKYPQDYQLRCYIIKEGE